MRHVSGCSRSLVDNSLPRQNGLPSFIKQADHLARVLVHQQAFPECRLCVQVLERAAGQEGGMGVNVGLTEA